MSLNSVNVVTGEPPVLNLHCHSTLNSTTGLLSAIAVWEVETHGQNSSLIFESLDYITVIVDEVGFGSQLLLNERLIGPGSGERFKPFGLGCAYEVHPNASGYFFITNLSFDYLQGDTLRFNVSHITIYSLLS